MNFLRCSDKEICRNDFIFEEEQKVLRKLGEYNMYNMHIKLYKEERYNITNIDSDSSSDNDNSHNSISVQYITLWRQLSESK